MNKRIAIALVALNVAFVAFILLVERGSLTTEDRAAGMQVLSQFDREDVDRVELVRGAEPAIVFVREPQDETDELGTWRIVEPIEDRIDDNALDELMVELQWLSAVRSLEEPSSADLARFGLDEPRYRVRFALEDRTIELRVGGDAEGGVYVAVEGIDRVHVVGRSLLETLDHDVDHFRDKALFHAFFPTDATDIRLRGQGEPLELERVDGVWHLRGSEVGWANRSLANALLDVTRDIEATRFIANEPDALFEYGLDTPWRALEVDRPADAAGSHEARLLVGDPCGEHNVERYARAGDGPVVCVMMSDVASLEVDRTQLRETRLLTVDDSAVQRILLTRGGRELWIRRLEDRFKVAVGSDDPVFADDQAVASWLSALRDLRAQSFEPFDGEPTHGLGAPIVTLTIERTDSDHDITLALGESDAGGAWVRRGDEALVLRAPAAVAELLGVDVLRFRDRNLLTRDAGQVREVQVSRGGITERATRGEGASFRLVLPIEAEADRVNLREIARQMATLRAAELVATEASPAHGLDAPRAELEVTFELEAEAADGAPATVTLKIGAATVAGAFAQLSSSPAVFELGREAVDALMRPLVSLDLATLDATTLTTLDIEGGQSAISLHRDGTRWLTADDALPDAESTRALLDRLATLRATGVDRYGELDAPIRTLTARGADGASTVLRFGATVGEGEGAYVPVQRVGVGVVYRFRADLVAPIVDYSI